MPSQCAGAREGRSNNEWIIRGLCAVASQCAGAREGRSNSLYFIQRSHGLLSLNAPERGRVVRTEIKVCLILRLKWRLNAPERGRVVRTTVLTPSSHALVTSQCAGAREGRSNGAVVSEENNIAKSLNAPERGRVVRTR